MKKLKKTLEKIVWADIRVYDTIYKFYFREFIIDQTEFSLKQNEARKENNNKSNRD